MPAPPHFNFPRKGDDYVSTLQTIKAQEFFADTVVEIVKDTVAAQYVVGTVGDPHPNTEKYPDHYLDIIIPDGPSHTARWVYVKNRGPLVSYQRTAEGQIETVTRTLEADDVTFPVLSALVTTASVENLANTKAIQTVGTVPTVFAQPIFTDTSPAYPAEFVIDEITAASTTAGTAAAPTAPTGGRATSEQVTLFVKRDTTTTPTLSKTLSERATNQYKQLVTVAKVADGTVGSPSATAEVEQTSMPGGRMMAVTKTVSGVFDAHSFSVEIPDPVPQEFRASVPTETETTRSAATSVSLPSLSGNQLRVVTSREDSFTIRTDTTTRNNGALPTLSGKEYEKTLDIQIPYTRKVLASGTSSAPHASVTPISSTQDVEMAYNNAAVATILDAYLATFPTTVNLSFPMELVGLEVVYETSFGDGDSSESGSGSAGGGTWQYSLNTTNSSQGSASVIPELLTRYRHVHGQNLPATDYYFFLPNPVTTADILTKIGGGISAWPIFVPEIHTFVLKGQKVSAAVSASARFSESANSDGGASESSSAGDSLNQDWGSTVGQRQLEECIHGDMTVFGDLTLTQDVSVAADASLAIGMVSIEGGPRSETLTANASIEPTSLSATAGATAVPTSGTGVYRSNVDLYGYNYSACRVTVFDFSVLA